jgi:uncharacterized repeat protein (TIGR02543 family)
MSTAAQLSLDEGDLTINTGGDYYITQSSGSKLNNINITGSADVYLFLENIDTYGNINAPNFTGDLYIILRGANSFTPSSAIPINAPNAAVYIFGDPETEGTNTLTAATTSGATGIEATYLEVDTVDALTIESGDTDAQSYGINANDGVTIINVGSLSVTSGSTSVSGGDVTIWGGYAAEKSYGIYSSGDVLLSALTGNVDVSSLSVTDNGIAGVDDTPESNESKGIVADDVTFEDCPEVEIYSSFSSGYSHGIEASGTTTVDNSFVGVTGSSGTVSTIGLKSGTLTLVGEPELMSGSMAAGGKAFEITTFDNQMTSNYDYEYVFTDDMADLTYIQGLETPIVQNDFTTNDDKLIFMLMSNESGSGDAVETETTSDGFVYTIFPSGSTAAIVGYTGNATAITIPTYIAGDDITLLVTAIGDNAFNAQYNGVPNPTYQALTSITVPDSVVTIGQSAFRYCTNLELLSLGGGVASIGENIVYADEFLTVNYIKNTAADNYAFTWFQANTVTKTPVGVKVDFEENGGSFISTPSPIYRIGASLPTNITKDGVTFGGWYTEDDGAGDKIESVTSDNIGSIGTTLYAKWEAAPDTYTVTLTVTKDGYAFASHGKVYYLKQDGVEKYTSTGTDGTVTFENVINGVYNINEYNMTTGKSVAVSSGNATQTLEYFTVTFDSNEGSTIDPQIVLKGKNLDVSNPTKAGYTFRGWSTDNTNWVQYNVGTGVQSTLPLYAFWRSNNATISAASLASEDVEGTFTGGSTIENSQELTVTIDDSAKTNAVLTFAKGNATSTVKYVKSSYEPSGDGLYNTTYGGSDTITVANGDVIWILVTAEDTITKKYYKITVTVPTPVTFNSATANGTNGTADTTELTLNFSADITGLTASDIDVTGATKGSLTSSGSGVYTLGISSITRTDLDEFEQGDTVSVSVSKTGYAVSGNPQTATVNKDTRTPITGTATITLDPELGTLTASISGTTNATSPAFSWSGTDVTDSSTAVLAADDDYLGQTVTVTISDSACSGTLTETITVYKVTVTESGNTGTDDATITNAYGEVGDGEVVGGVTLPLSSSTGQILTGLAFETKRTAQTEAYVAENFDAEVLGSFETAQKGGWGDEPATLSVGLDKLGFEAEDGTKLQALIYDPKAKKWYTAEAEIIDGNVVIITKRSGVVTIVAAE